jgi:hypothetical protein
LSEGRTARTALGELRRRSTPAGDAGRMFTTSAGLSYEDHDLATG